MHVPSQDRSGFTGISAIPRSHKSSLPTTIQHEEEQSDSEENECSYEYVVDSNQKDYEQQEDDGDTTNEMYFKIFETANELKCIDKQFTKVKDNIN